MTNLFVAPTFLCAATQVAAIEAGMYEGNDHVLLVTNNASIPEISDSLLDSPGMAALRAPFREVRLLNDLTSPYHPRSFEPDRVGTALLKRDILGAFGVESFRTITAQSVHTRPTRTIFELFPGARLSVISDGLMSYGPTRFELPSAIADRIERLLHLDLVPGLKPVLLSEFGVPATVVPTDGFREVVRAYGEHGGDSSEATGSGPAALLLGQYLAALGIITETEEAALHVDMLRAAADLGAERIVFKPHPSAPPTLTESLTAEAQKRGVDLTILTTSTPVEVLYETFRPDYVIGSFSTGLSTAQSMFGLTAVTVGTDYLVTRLPSPKDSNRVPLAISHVTLHGVGNDRGGTARLVPPLSVDVHMVVRALSHRMQPTRYAGIVGRDDAESLMSEHPQLQPFFELETPRASGKEPAKGQSLFGSGPVHAVRVLSYRVERRLPRSTQPTMRMLRARTLRLKER